VDIAASSLRKQIVPQDVEVIVMRVPVGVVDRDAAHARSDQPPRHQAGLPQCCPAIFLAQGGRFAGDVERLLGRGEVISSTARSPNVLTLRAPALARHLGGLAITIDVGQQFVAGVDAVGVNRERCSQDRVPQVRRIRIGIIVNGTAAAPR